MEIYRCAAAIPEQSCQLRFADVDAHHRLSPFGKPAHRRAQKPILYFITLLRGIVMPLIAAVLLRFTGWDRTTCLCIVMVLGCSVATVISIFGVRYDRSPEMASKSVLQSNLLLPVTMPLMMFIAERIL